MRPIRDMWFIQIEVTNACNIHCANCTRFVGHHKKPFFMELSMIEKAIDSLEGHRGAIGIIGGEPTTHPDFLGICQLVQKKIPKDKRGLWTSGYKWKQYESIIRETFGEYVVYNDHSIGNQAHQPLLIAINDCIEDKDFMWGLINKCWVQRRWSASITPRGGFFCEVAAAMNMLFEEEEGYPIEKRWWDKTPEQFRDQIKKYCINCGAALPISTVLNKHSKDLVSITNYHRLEAIKSPKFLKGDIELFDKKMTREDIRRAMKNWKPWEYLGVNGQRSKEKLYGSINSRAVKAFQYNLAKNIFQKYREVKRNISKWLIWHK